MRPELIQFAKMRNRTLILCLLLCAVLPITSTQTGTSQPATTTPHSQQYNWKHYLKIGGDVLPPNPLETPQPSGPNTGCKPRHDETVVLQIGIGETGTIEAVKVLRSVGRDLDQKAIEEVTKWRFAPATTKGQAVPSQTDVQVNFHLC